jgi:hypothetical protein
MAILKVKDEHVQPRLINILCGIANVAAKLAVPSEIVITAGIDGTHSVNSKHYMLSAVDLRTHNFPDVASKDAFILALQLELGADYLLLLESKGLPNEHLHVGFKG